MLAGVWRNRDPEWRSSWSHASVGQCTSTGPPCREGKYNNTQSIMVTFGPFQSLKRRVIIHLVHEQQLPIIKNKIVFPFIVVGVEPPPVHYRALYWEGKAGKYVILHNREGTIQHIL